ncbi:hypothetical protein [Streptomyces sp. AC550_RSS872]|uniref:hypothetical protein n=1 Tax=Streptomyces sp. AC550_RSS872 TaxID=2823689 RepID=UPI001C278087|nr:hypothetical protein [Streptomyces sp. AC550_RSS872]
MTLPHSPTPAADPEDGGRLAELSGVLRQLVQAGGVMLPAAAYAFCLVLLYRYGGQSALVVGVSNGAGVTTPVRAEVGGSFRALVRLAGARPAEAEQARSDTPMRPWPGFSCRSAPRCLQPPSRIGRVPWPPGDPHLDRASVPRPRARPVQHRSRPPRRGGAQPRPAVGKANSAPDPARQLHT